MEKMALVRPSVLRRLTGTSRDCHKKVRKPQMSKKHQKRRGRKNKTVTATTTAVGQRTKARKRPSADRRRRAGGPPSARFSHRRYFPRRRVVVGGPYDQWQVDLVNVSEYAGENEGMRYLLCCLEAFTKFAWLRTLKSKRASEVAEALRDILREAPEGPLYVMSDKGREFLGKPFADLLREEGIRYFNTQNDDVKSCLVERFQRTLQETVHRYFPARNTRRYVDVLQRLVTSYNATHHHSLGMSARQALRADPEDVWYNLYEKAEPRWAFRRRRRRAYLEPGDHVRISKTKGRLPEKGYLGGWSLELFRVSARLKTAPVTYRISDASGEELKGSFYKQELGKAHLPDFF